MSSEDFLYLVGRRPLDEVMGYLHTHQFNPNLPGRFGRYPLFAAIVCHSTIAEYFINLPNIDLNIIDGNGAGVMHYAAKYNRLELYKLLRAKDCQINVFNHKSKSPLTYAIINNNLYFVDKLLADDATIQLVDIRMAIKHNEYSLFVDLVNQIDQSLITDDILIDWMFDIVIYENDIKYFNYLKDNYFDDELLDQLATATDNHDDTMLAHAVYCDIDIVRTLLKHGADVNTIDYYNNTPLSNAIDGNNIEIIELLLGYGADPFYKKNDKTILEIVREDVDRKDAYQAIQNYLDMPDIKGAEED